MTYSLIKTLAISTFAMTASIGMATSNPINANSDILFVLDGSGSMWGQIDGIAKMDTAKTTLTKLLNDVPSNARLGLMTYGTTDKNSCADVSYVNPIGSNRLNIQQTIANIQPLGKTPIDLSLAMGITHLANAQPTDTQKSLVLISDGIETCDGTPCNTATAAKVGGVSMKVHVVGFNVDSAARNQLECIARAGGGQYFNASDTAGFQNAMTSVVQIAQAPSTPAAPVEAETQPQAPKSVMFFEEEFDGEALTSNWSVANEDEDSYIVEDGNLLMVTSKVQGMASGEPTNLLTMTDKLPKGDWDMNVRLKFDAQTGRDNFWFGLYKDPQNFMGAQYFTSVGYCSETAIQLVKASKGETAKFKARTSGSTKCGFGKNDHEKVIASQAQDGMVLTLSKRGRNYTASATLNGIVGEAGTPRKVTTQALTSLRLPGQPALMIGKFDSADGEVLSFIDRVEIISIK